MLPSSKFGVTKLKDGYVSLPRYKTQRSPRVFKVSGGALEDLYNGTSAMEFVLVDAMGLRPYQARSQLLSKDIGKSKFTKIDDISSAFALSNPAAFILKLRSAVYSDPEDEKVVLPTLRALSAALVRLSDSARENLSKETITVNEEQNGPWLNVDIFTSAERVKQANTLFEIEYKDSETSKDAVFTDKYGCPSAFRPVFQMFAVLLTKLGKSDTIHKEILAQLHSEELWTSLTSTITLWLDAKNIENKNPYSHRRSWMDLITGLQGCLFLLLRFFDNDVPNGSGDFYTPTKRIMNLATGLLGSISSTKHRHKNPVAEMMSGVLLLEITKTSVEKLHRGSYLADLSNMIEKAVPAYRAAERSRSTDLGAYLCLPFLLASNGLIHVFRDELRFADYYYPGISPERLKEIEDETVKGCTSVIGTYFAGLGGTMVHDLSTFLIRKDLHYAFQAFCVAYSLCAHATSRLATYDSSVKIKPTIGTLCVMSQILSHCGHDLCPNSTRTIYEAVNNMLETQFPDDTHVVQSSKLSLWKEAAARYKTVEERRKALKSNMDSLRDDMREAVLGQKEGVFGHSVDHFQTRHDPYELMRITDRLIDAQVSSLLVEDEKSALKRNESIKLGDMLELICIAGVVEQCIRHLGDHDMEVFRSAFTIVEKALRYMPPEAIAHIYSRDEEIPYERIGLLQGLYRALVLSFPKLKSSETRLSHVERLFMLALERLYHEKNIFNEQRLGITVDFVVSYIKLRLESNTMDRDLLVYKIKEKYKAIADRIQPFLPKKDSTKRA